MSEIPAMFRGLDRLSDHAGRRGRAGRQRRPATALLGRLEGGGASTSIGLLGSTGTYAYLSRAGAAARGGGGGRAACGGRVPVIVGVGRAPDRRRAGAGAGRRGGRGGRPAARAGLLHAAARGGGVPALPSRSRGRRTCRSASTTTRRRRTSRFSAGPGRSGWRGLPASPPLKTPAPAPPRLRRAHRGAARAGAGRLSPSAAAATGAAADARARPARTPGTAWSAGCCRCRPSRSSRAAQAGDRAEAQRVRRRASAPLWDLFRELSSLRVVYAAAAILGTRDGVASAADPAARRGGAPPGRRGARSAGRGGTSGLRRFRPSWASCPEGSSCA